MLINIFRKEKKVKVGGSRWSLNDVLQALVSLTSTTSNCFSSVYLLSFIIFFALLLSANSKNLREPQDIALGIQGLSPFKQE